MFGLSQPVESADCVKKSFLFVCFAACPLFYDAAATSDSVRPNVS